MKIKKLCCLLQIFGLLLPVANYATAQTSTIIEEMMVTARKKEESVYDVPETVTNFSSTAIENSNMGSLKDIGLMVPNLYMSTRLDGFPNVTIRGLGGFGNTQGVGFYLDDVQLFSDASSRFGDLERIEVLKGPQGVLYGGSNIGGAVKFVSARPSFDSYNGSVKLSAGEFGYGDIEAQANIPLSTNWAMRLFGFYESYDGYLNNPGTPRENGQRTESSSDIGEGDQYGVRATIAGDITDRLSTFITLRHNELDGPNNTWIRELDGDFEYGNTVDVSFNPRHLRDTQGASVQFDYDFDDVLATLITSYTQTDSERDTELDMDKEWVLDLFRPEEFEAKTVEFRLSSQNDAPLQWQAGVYALDLTRDLSSVLNVRGGYCFLDPGDCSPQPPSNDNEIQAVLPFEVSLKEREQLAAFANITYRFNDWEFSAGIRADDWESKRTNVDTGLSGTQTDTEILSRASLTWFDPDSDSIVYGTFSQGFEPGDLNLANFSGENTLFGYDAEKANQYEVGYKGRINDSKVAITAAAFYIDYQDRQFELQTTDPAGGFVEGIINLGDSTQWGLESDVIYLINDNWTATVGVGYVNAEWNDGVISPVSGVDLSGQRPPNTAEISGTFALDYETEIDSGALLSARIQTRYKGDSSTNSQFFDMPGDDFPYWENPSFVVVDIGGAIQWSSWEARLHIENIFDEEYYIDVQEFPNFAGTALSGNPGSIIVGSLEQPRRAVLSLSYDF